MSHSGAPLLSLLKPQWSAPSSIGAFVTTRLGGVSAPPYDALNLGAHVGDLPENVNANRDLLNQFLPAKPLWLDQIHSSCVSTPATRLSQADAIVTKEPGQVLAIMTADCLPVLFTSSKGTVIGAAHAGWRGLCAGVLENTVRAMRELLEDSNDQILAWLGPAIGPKAFEVGSDVVECFKQSSIVLPQEAFISIPNRPGKYFANIYLLARSRLESVGLSQISGGNFCTVSQKDQFFSYRRDGITGRFASLIWIK